MQQFLVLVFSKYFQSNLLLMEIRRKFALTRPRGSHWPIDKVDLRNLFLAHDGRMQFTL